MNRDIVQTSCLLTACILAAIAITAGVSITGRRSPPPQREPGSKYVQIEIDGAIYSMLQDWNGIPVYAVRTPMGPYTLTITTESSGVLTHEDSNYDVCRSNGVWRIDDRRRADAGEAGVGNATR